MQSLIHADIFFFISSIGFVILFVLLIIAIIYVIRLLRSLNEALEVLKAKAKDIEADAEDLIEEVRESVVFRLLFGRKHRTRTRKE